MIPPSGDGDVVVARLGVELGRGQIADGRNADDARLAVAVLAVAVGGAAIVLVILYASISKIWNDNAG